MLGLICSSIEAVSCGFYHLGMVLWYATSPLVLALAPLPDANPSVQREIQAHGKDELISVLWGQWITITEITFLIHGSQQCLRIPSYQNVITSSVFSPPGKTKPVLTSFLWRKANLIKILFILGSVL